MLRLIICSTVYCEVVSSFLVFPDTRVKLTAYSYDAAPLRGERTRSPAPSGESRILKPVRKTGSHAASLIYIE